TDAEYVVELEVPGFDEQELAVEVTDHQLLVKGSREEETERTERTALLRERLERRFERTFELPLAADTEHVSASYGKGVLTVHVPKTSTGEPHMIEITKE
ncbi:MAG TPA: Hsp20/alpha crystallin family protein, partial [Gaiellaceae bacterium]|nr:Hsp20/alpha crystallin family protein [Gaiellaceae bacterium]